jgi:putative effector of murein hydrolase
VSAAAVAALAATLGCYLAAARLDRRVRRPWTNPVGATVLALVVVVGAGAIPLADYERGTAPLVWALRPAVVALGWLLHRQRAELRRWALPLLAGSAAGSLVSLLVTPLLARALGAGPALQAALALKSVTSAVGVDLAGRVGADAALTVPFVILTGIVGAAAGPPLLRWTMRVAPPALGVAVGTNSHGIGTAAMAAREGELPTALAGLAMAATAVISGLVAPLAFALLGLG